MPLFLLILESIGTQELIMIAILALIFLGPRKLPQMARTIGKTMADFRSTTNEFKSTWEREVNFDAEEKALRTGEIEESNVPRIAPSDPGVRAASAPAITAIDKQKFDNVVRENNENAETAADDNDTAATDILSDKRKWL